MKSGKIVSLDDYRMERHGRGDKTRKADSGTCIPSADRLWELLDRNISIDVWREQNCA
jgi:hypothetical protein